MPTYEYACRDCGDHVEVVQSFKDDPLTICPACGGELRKVFGNIGIAFKGSGFYRNDSRSKTASASSTSGESKSETKSGESKSGEAKSGEAKSDGSKSKESKEKASSKGDSSSGAPTTSTATASAS